MASYDIIQLEPENYFRCNAIWDMHQYPDQTEKWFRQMLDGNRIIFVYTEAGEYLGEGSLVLDRHDPDYTIPDRRVYLSRMVVKKGHRNRGIGGILLDHLCDYARGLGFSEISIGVDIDNVNARHLYEKKGFTEVLFEGEDEIGKYVKLLKRL